MHDRQHSIQGQTSSTLVPILPENYSKEPVWQHSKHYTQHSMSSLLSLVVPTTLLRQTTKNDTQNEPKTYDEKIDEVSKILIYSKKLGEQTLTPGKGTQKKSNKTLMHGHNRENGQQKASTQSQISMHIKQHKRTRLKQQDHFLTKKQFWL